MAEMMQTIEHLVSEIGPRPVATEEEQQASLYIAQELKDLNLPTEVEEFQGSVSHKKTRLVCSSVAVVFALVSLFLPVIALPAIIISFVCAVFFMSEELGKPILSKFLDKGISQNVVARFVPAAVEEGRGRRRKVVLVSRVDSGSVRPELSEPFLNAMPVFAPAARLGMVILPLYLLIRSVFFLHSTGAAFIISTFLLIAVCLCAALTTISFVLEKISGLNDGANSSASGVAVMLEVARRITQENEAANPDTLTTSLAQDSEQNADQNAQFALEEGVGEADLQKNTGSDEQGYTPDGQAYQRADSSYTQNKPENQVTIHGAAQAYEQGVVPEGAALVYENRAQNSRGNNSPSLPHAAAVAVPAAVAAGVAAGFTVDAVHGGIVDASAASSTFGQPDAFAQASQTPLQELNMHGVASAQLTQAPLSATLPDHPSQAGGTQAGAVGAAGAAGAAGATGAAGAAPNAAAYAAPKKEVPSWFSAGRAAARANAPAQAQIPTAKRSTFATALEAAEQRISEAYQVNTETQVNAETPNNSAFGVFETTTAAQAVVQTDVQATAQGDVQVQPPVNTSFEQSEQAKAELQTQERAHVEAQFETPAQTQAKTQEETQEDSQLLSQNKSQSQQQPERQLESQQSYVQSQNAHTQEQPAQEQSVQEQAAQEQPAQEQAAQEPEAISMDYFMAAAAGVRTGETVIATPVSPDTERKPLVLPDLSVTGSLPVAEIQKQRAPLAQLEEEHAPSANARSNAQIASRGAADGFASSLAPDSNSAAQANLRANLPSLSGMLDQVEATQAFEPVAGATGSFAPVTEALVASSDNDEELFVDDADDSAFDDNYTESGAYAGPEYVDMPKKRGRGLFDKLFGGKKKEESPDNRSFDDEDDDAWEGGAFSEKLSGIASGASGVASRVRSALPKGKSEQEEYSEEFDADNFEHENNERSAENEEYARVCELIAQRYGTQTQEAFDNNQTSLNTGDSDVNEAMQRIEDFRAGGIETEVWFVSLGAETDCHAGMEEFIEVHREELRGCIVIELDSLGAGNLCNITKEGALLPVTFSSRMKRYAKRAAQLAGITVENTTMCWQESAASVAIRGGLQAMHVVGMSGKKPALYAQADDVLDNISAETLSENANFVTEVVKSV